MMLEKSNSYVHMAARFLWKPLFYTRSPQQPQFLYGTEEDQFVENGLTLLKSNFVKDIGEHGEKALSKENKTFC